MIHYKTQIILSRINRDIYIPITFELFDIFNIKIHFYDYVKEITSHHKNSHQIHGSINQYS